MYSEEQYRKALEVYEETKSVTKTITIDKGLRTFYWTIWLIPF
jgi:hypothetical protein